MKLKFTVSSWTILIPSLVLNIGLLIATVFFLQQMDIFYAQVTSPTPKFELGSEPPMETIVPLVVHGSGSQSSEIRGANGPLH